MDRWLCCCVASTSNAENVTLAPDNVVVPEASSLYPLATSGPQFPRLPKAGVAIAEEPEEKEGNAELDTARSAISASSMSPEEKAPKADLEMLVEVFERDELLKVRWLVGCEELKEGTTRKSIIRQIFLPGEWLSSDDHEPEASRHGKEPRHSRAQAPAAAVPSSAGVHGDTPVKAKEKKEEESEHFAVQSGAKQSDGSTGVGSTFDTSSNSSKESNHEAKDSSNSSRNVINISNCIGSGDSSGARPSASMPVSALPAELPLPRSKRRLRCQRCWAWESRRCL
ncbi:unnamed protein product [Effrenium voratum]|nr:unnamed protein product [Effrenium voratum]